MKSTKTLAAAVFALAATAAFAAPKTTASSSTTGARGTKGPDFSNTVYSDVVKITSVSSGDTTKSSNDVQPIFDTMSVELISSKVDTGIKVTTALGKGSQMTGFSFTNGITYDDYYVATGFQMDDWYIEWRPVTNLTVGFHDDIYTAGSRLQAAGVNLANGNMGSDVVFCYRPIAGLRACAGIDFTSYFGKENTAPKFNFGIDYTYGSLASFGLTALDFANDSRLFGFYGTYSGVNNLTLGAGYSIAEGRTSTVGVTGNILNLTAVYKYSDLTAAFDFVTNFSDKKDTTYDLYAGLNAKYAVTKDANVYLAATVIADFGKTSTNPKGEEVTTSLDPVYTIQPGADFTVGEHTLGAAAKFVFTKNTTIISFPVFWRASL